MVLCSHIVGIYTQIREGLAIPTSLSIGILARVVVVPTIHTHSGLHLTYTAAIQNQVYPTRDSLKLSLGLCREIPREFSVSESMSLLHMPFRTSAQRLCDLESIVPVSPEMGLRVGNPKSLSPGPTARELKPGPSSLC